MGKDDKENNDPHKTRMFSGADEDEYRGGLTGGGWRKWAKAYCAGLKCGCSGCNQITVVYNNHSAAVMSNSNNQA